MENTFFDDITVDESLEIDGAFLRSILAIPTQPWQVTPIITRPIVAPTPAPPVMVPLYGIVIRPI